MIYNILLMNLSNSFKSKANGGLPLKTVSLDRFLSCHWFIILAVFMIGVWKDVEGYEGFYQVSDTESVRSLDRVVNSNTGKRLFKGRMLKQGKNKHGYLTVSLCNGVVRTKKVHRLVGKAFIPNPNNYPQINHKNGIKTDNRVENLEWCTSSQNIIHSFKNGLSSQIGEKNAFSKLTKRQVVEIKNKLFQGFKCVDLAKKYGVNRVTISDIKTGKNWSHV